MKLSKKHKAEFELLQRLQDEHSYSLREVRKGSRIIMMFSSALKTIEPMRVCELVVPKDSALAASLDNLADDVKKSKTHKESP